MKTFKVQLFKYNSTPDAHGDTYAEKCVDDFFEQNRIKKHPLYINHDMGTIPIGESVFIKNKEGLSAVFSFFKESDEYLANEKPFCSYAFYGDFRKNEHNGRLITKINNLLELTLTGNPANKDAKAEIFTKNENKLIKTATFTELIESPIKKEIMDIKIMTADELNAYLELLNGQETKDEVLIEEIKALLLTMEKPTNEEIPPVAKVAKAVKAVQAVPVKKTAVVPAPIDAVFYKEAPKSTSLFQKMKDAKTSHIGNLKLDGDAVFKCFMRKATTSATFMNIDSLQIVNEGYFLGPMPASPISFFNVSATENSYFDYNDITVSAGQPEFLAELASGGAISQITVRTIVYLKRLQATTECSNTVLLGQSDFNNALNDLLANSFASKLSYSLINGDGIGDAAFGLKYYATALSTTNYTNSIKKPTNWDVLNIAITEQRALGFMPNAVFLNPIDCAMMMAEKNSVGDAYKPNDTVTISAEGKFTVSGVEILPLVQVLKGTFFVVDGSKVVVRVGGGDSLGSSIKYFDSDRQAELTDSALLSIKTHYNMRVATQDNGGVTTGDFASIIADITKL